MNGLLARFQCDQVGLLPQVESNLEESPQENQYDENLDGDLPLAEELIDC